MKLSSLNQAIKRLNILKTSFLTSLFVFIYHFLFSQCTSNQIEFEVEVTTDQWGYEAYWEITEQNSDCGVNTVFFGGNSTVGCSGGGLQVASASDPGAYSNNSTVLSLPFCLDLDSCYTFHMVDDYGDGGTSYNIMASGLPGVVASFSSEGTMNSVVFCASVPVPYDLALDVNSEDANGWNLNHIRPVPDPFYPISQLNQNETVMGVNVVNYGFQAPIEPYVRLNIDKEDISGNWTTVYTDTIDFSNEVSWFPVFPDYIDNHFRTKEINDESWYSLGKFRYQYIAHQAVTDLNPANDTITGYFTLTEDYWSRVSKDEDDNPNGRNATIPGTSSALTKYEWGSFFHFPNGSGVTVEELKTKFMISPTSQASSYPYQARIYEVNSTGTVLNLDTDLYLRGINSDTISGNPGDTVVGIIDVFYDISSVNPLAPDTFFFQNDKLYYISIFQENYFSPYLNDGTTINGLMIFRENINHESHVYNSNSESYPYYNPFEVTDALNVSYWYNQGFNESPEPSFGIKLGGCIQNSGSTQSQTACSSYEWPTNGQTYTESGQYTEVLTNASGCDSTVTLNLTIINSNSSSESITECDSYTWNTNGQTYTESGQYTEVLTNQSGCDSTVTLNLIITNSNSTSESITECDSYTWSTNSQTYTESGQYTEILSNQSGCDSTVTLDLTINSSSSSTQTQTGIDSYTWSVNNETYTESGTYTAVIPNVSGCDSTITLDLTLEFTGLDENELSYVAVYPNPTFNSFILSTKDMINMNFSLLDIQGKVVLTGKIESSEETVDISNLSRGQYNLVFDDESISPISIIKN